MQQRLLHPLYSKAGCCACATVVQPQQQHTAIGRGVLGAGRQQLQQKMLQGPSRRVLLWPTITGNGVFGRNTTRGAGWLAGGYPVVLCTAQVCTQGCCCGAPDSSYVRKQRCFVQLGSARASAFEQCMTARVSPHLHDRTRPLAVWERAWDSLGVWRATEPRRTVCTYTIHPTVLAL